MKLPTAALLLFILSAGVAGCAGSVAAAPEDGTVHLGHVKAGHITISGLTLGKDRLEDSLNVFGRATVSLGRYRHEPRRVCYHSSDPADKTALVFETDLFGDWSRLTSFELGGEGIHAGDTCMLSGLVSRELATQSGLRLGLTRDEVAAILGPPGIVRGDLDKYIYIVEERLPKESVARMAEFSFIVLEQNVTTTIIDAQFKDDRLVRLRVRWTESI